MALGEQGIEMGYCYNRKEKKDVSSLTLPFHSKRGDGGANESTVKEDQWLVHP
jgi:hypothetical protein